MIGNSSSIFIRRALIFLKKVRSCGYPTASWLAEKEEVSVRTIHRLIDRLRYDFDIPLVYDRFNRGWALENDNWEFFAANLITKKEIFALIFAIESFVSTDDELNDLLSNIYFKLIEKSKNFENKWYILKKKELGVKNENLNNRIL